jgi:hypothetical protein
MWPQARRRNSMPSQDPSSGAATSTGLRYPPRGPSRTASRELQTAPVRLKVKLLLTTFVGPVLSRSVEQIFRADGERLLAKAGAVRR